MFGSGSFDKEEYRKWQKHIPSIASAVKNKRLFVIISSRTYILSEALEKFFVESFFTKENIVTLSSEQLTKSEKSEILEKHLSKASTESTFNFDIASKTEIINEIIELELAGPELGGLAIGFPECARLFSSNNSLYQIGADFFKNPMACVRSYISNLLQDDNTLMAFFVLWAQESKCLSSLDLERPIVDIIETIQEPIRMLQFQPETCIRKIRHVLRQHRGGFICFNDRDETFKFSHRVVQDAVGLVSYEINPTAVIEHSDASFIENFFSVNTSESVEMGSVYVSHLQRPKPTHPMKIYLSHARYTQISMRLGSIFIKSPSYRLENAASLFRLGIFDNQDFCSAFLDYLKNEGRLISFLKAEIRSIRSELAKFRFLNNVSTENMGVISYLIWMKEDVCPLMETCLEYMLSLNLSLHKEFNMSLLISLKLGSCKLVKCLLEKGAEVDFNHIALAIVTDRDDLLYELVGFIPKIEILHTACKAGYLEVVMKLCNDELDLTQPDEDCKSLIKNAVVGGNVDVFEILLKTYSLQLPLTNVIGRLPIYHYIVSKDNPDLIDALTRNGIRPTIVDNKGRSPFLYAIYMKKLSVIEKLFQLSIEDNVHCLPDNYQKTPLNMAVLTVLSSSSGIVKHVFYELALRLCSFSENIHCGISHTETALELACKGGLNQIVKAILKHGDPYVYEGSSLFHHFVTTGNETAISYLLECDIDPNVHDEFDRTPFMLAKDLGKTSILKILQNDRRIVEYNEDEGNGYESFDDDYVHDNQDVRYENIYKDDIKLENYHGSVLKKKHKYKRSYINSLNK